MAHRGTSDGNALLEITLTMQSLIKPQQVINEQEQSKGKQKSRESVDQSKIQEFFRNSLTIILERHNSGIFITIGEDLIPIREFIIACNFFDRSSDNLILYLSTANTPYITETDIPKLSEIMHKKVTVVDKRDNTKPQH